MADSISIVMPALNEEPRIASAVAAVREALDDLCEYEIIIFDDGSTDNTGKVADELAREDGRISVVHNGVNKGLGYNYRKGADLARLEYLLMVPGDDETPASTIRAICSSSGAADLVLTYTINGHIRPLFRRAVSRVFTLSLNILFGLRLRYYNGNSLIRTQLVKTMPVDTSGFAYMAALVARLIKRGHSYCEMGILLQPREAGKSKALSAKSFLSVVKTVLSLTVELRKGQRRSLEGMASVD